MSTASYNCPDCRARIELPVKSEKQPDGSLELVMDQQPYWDHMLSTHGPRWGE